MSTVQEISFEDFFGVKSPRRTASIYRLIKSEAKLTESLTSIDNSSANYEFEFIKEVMEEFARVNNIQPISIELSLLLDERGKSRVGEYSKFYSYLGSWVGSEWISSYDTAMQSMTKDDAANNIGNDTILLHPDLYDKAKVDGVRCFTIPNPNDFTDAFNSADKQLETSDFLSYGRAFVKDWTKNPSTTVNQQIERFYKALCRIRPDAMHGTTIWIWPINKPGVAYQTTTVKSVSRPAGALFLLGKQLSKSNSEIKANTKALALGVSNHLHELLLRDSNEILDDLSRKTTVTQVSLHSLANLIRGMNIEHMFNGVSKVIGFPDDILDLDIGITDKSDDNTGKLKLERFLSVCRNLLTLQETALTISALGEIALDEVARNKFTNDTSVGLASLLEKTSNTFGNSLVNKSINHVSLKYDDDLLTKIYVPVGYLDRRIIGSIFYEILGNALNYANISEDVLEVTIKTEIIEDAILLKIHNEKTVGSNIKTNKSAGRYLDNVSEILNLWGDLDIEYDDSNDKLFETTFRLGRVLFEGKDEFKSSCLEVLEE